MSWAGPAAAVSGTNTATATTNTLLPDTCFATPCHLIDSGNPGPTVMVVGGMHGNEPAGAMAAEGIRHWPIQNGRLIVIPRANFPGLEAGKRLIPGLETNLSNLNRNFPRANGTNLAARGELAQAIWKIAADQKPDWVIDLHEGFDFHQLNEKSVGSSIICFPIAAGQSAADEMLASVNETITNALLKFVRREMPIDGSLARAAGEHLRVPAMIIETTSTQPMEQRVQQHQIAVGSLLVRLGMLDQSNLPDALTKTPAPPWPIKAALYKGPGTGGNGPPDLLKLLNATNAPTSVVEVTPDEIRAGILTNFDVVIFAGGSGSQEAKAIGEQGRAEVEKFVGHGGGYIGICAGAYLATSGYPWSLHLVNAKTLSPKWQRGRAVLKMELTPAGAAMLGGPTNVDVLYHQGPVVGPANATNLPPYEVLAYFRTEVASNNTPAGIMINSPAIFAGQFKSGKVVCISPHPEQTAGLEYIVPQAIHWVTSATGRAQ
ncbi:MAG: succinylglutamate desuccinylase/aspartoacylase family protein [Verrucomicrobiota bacterium]